MRSDEDLMLAYAAGEQSAFDKIFARLGGVVLAIARRHTRDEQEARDLVQQTFLNLHRARGDFRAGARLKPWLVTIALNVCREHHRRRGRRREQQLEAGAEPQVDGAQVKAATEEERRVRVRSALAELPRGQREVVELFWLADLSFPEVAATLGLEVSAAKVRAHRAYKKLREILATSG